METSLKKSCLGSLYLANSNAIQNSCKFKVAEASERIFELAENTWAVYSTGTINTNQVCQARNTIQTRQINSGDPVTVEPGCYIQTGSRDLSGQIRNYSDPEEDHGLDRQAGRILWQGRPYGHTGTPDQVQWRIRRKRVVQGTRPDQASGGPLDLHIASCHDWHCLGPLPDGHADLEEMFQHP